MHTQDAPKPCHSSIDLQIAVLRHLPTPVVVLSPSPHRTVVFANRAAERLLGWSDPPQTQELEILGRTPSDLRIKLLYNRVWKTGLDQVVASREDDPKDESFEKETGRASSRRDADVAILNEKLAFKEKHYRMLIAPLTAHDGVRYILSMEKHPEIGRKAMNDDGIHLDISTTTPHQHQQ